MIKSQKKEEEGRISLNEMGIRGNAAIKKVRVKRKRKEKHRDFLKAEDSRIRYTVSE